MPDEDEKGSLFGNSSSTQGTPSIVTGAYGSSKYAFREQEGLTQSIFSAPYFAPIDSESSTQGTPSTTTSTHNPSSNFASTAREMSTQSSLPAPSSTPVTARHKRKSPRNINGCQKRLKQQWSKYASNINPTQKNLVSWKCLLWKLMEWKTGIATDIA